MKTFKDILEPLIDSFEIENNEYKIVVNTDDKMIYAIPQDQKKGELMADILEKIGEMKMGIEILFGKQIAYGVPTISYLDRDGSVINIVRDKDKKKVTLSWIKGR